ncbi:peptide chain release factor N(5)-glutamine methyltransferase [Zhouia sp. PK063]|uniref:peptide chain release factor N(5)-glutamine methyltransferase n=1 Tax=Zhouia sp. PK063 TaxID=3373602 RepID=UPI0037A7FF3A
MLVKEIQHIFHKELDELFGKEEVDSFFFMLIAYYNNLSRLSLVLSPDMVFTKDEEQPIFEALSRLKLQEPIQYIIGEAYFFGLSFKVNKHTLIPRPETEELVQWIIATVDKNKEIHILDIGTGTGCIAISLAANLPNAKVSAIDVSHEAIEIARFNATKNEVKVNFIKQNILEVEKLPHYFDIIVSNPPYVRELEKREMKPNVLNYEPNLALFVSNSDPLIFYKKIATLAQQYLLADGKLFFEINQYLGTEMQTMLQQLNFKNIQLKQDIRANNRMLLASK